jgi:putative inorganic carbon (hco3(-)) transporter
VFRLIFVFSIIGAGAYYSLQGPFYALLFYIWNAYFRPEFWVWDDMLLSLRLSLTIGLFLLVSSLSSFSRLKWNRQLILVVLFAVQATVSVVVSEHSDRILNFWIEFIKVILITVLITVLVDDERKFRLTIGVMAFSLGFEAAKQGWATFVRNPGATNINEHIMLGDNNGVALGMMMLVPLFMALTETTKDWRERMVHRFFVAGVFYRAISTYSRGGFIAAGVVSLISLWRAKYPIRMLLAVAVVAYSVSAVMPQSFWDRMSSITASEDSRDDSAAGRLYYWQLATRMANDHPLTGVGFNAFRYSYNEYDLRAGGPGGMRAVHSVWFGSLSELGYPGFFLFVAMLGGTIVSCEQVRRRAKREGKERIAIYAGHLQTCIVVFCVGGTFLNAQYLELIWHFVGLSVALERIAATSAATAVQPSEPQRRKVVTTPRYVPRHASSGNAGLMN